MSPFPVYDMAKVLLFHTPFGKLYTALAVVWTAILCCGVTFVVLNRNLPFLRVRNIALALSAVATLHVYWVLCHLAYGLNGYFPCGTEFWIMNIYLPLGIALAHASNTQLLYVANHQRKYATTKGLSAKEHEEPCVKSCWQKYFQDWKKIGNADHTMIWIGCGMLAQLIVALIIFFVSKKFHYYGIIGTPLAETSSSRINCRRGWEWLPSIVWQFFWAWIYAPYLLWKLRGIRDVHSWRLQTICCCLSGLPATPMWLIALYVPGMTKVNHYFIPPLWFAPSIFLFEAFMVFVPCYHILRNRKLKKETLDIIAEWERQKNISLCKTVDTNTDAGSRLSLNSSSHSTTSSRKAQAHLYTMVALEKALNTNSTPLLLFAAFKDFSGENISFLNHVSEWKNLWRPSSRASSFLHADLDPMQTIDTIRRHQFSRALAIYSSFISLKYSDYPINISSAELKELEGIFEFSAALVKVEKSQKNNEVTPFDDVMWDDGPTDLESIVHECSETPRHHATNNHQMQELGDNLPEGLIIPDDFNPDVFDQAVESIKYTVLTNTWPKFVNAGYTAAQMDKDLSVRRLQQGIRPSGWSRLQSL